MSGIALERLYVGFFGRPAEPVALDYWNTAVEQGAATPATLRAAFAASAEFQALAAQGNAALVNRIYFNAFGHGPDADGLAYWAGALEQGALSPDLLPEAIIQGAQGADAVGFQDKLIAAQIFSAAWDLRSGIASVGLDPVAEVGAAYLAGVTDHASLNTALDNLYETVTAGIEQLIPLEADQHMSDKHGGALVEQTYVAFFGHAADRAGLAYWEGALDGGLDPARMQAAFAQSAEFQASTAGMDHAHLVDHLYLNLFGRHVDLDGLVFWTGALDTGASGVDDLAWNLARGAVGNDAEALRAKIVAASAWTAAVPLLGETASYLAKDTGFVVGVADDAALNLALDQLYEGLSGDIIVHPALF